MSTHVLILSCSEQEGQAFLIQARCRRGHQRLGRWCCWHDCWQRAPSDHPGEACVRQQSSSRHSGQLGADLRYQVHLSQLDEKASTSVDCENTHRTPSIPIVQCLELHSCAHGSRRDVPPAFEPVRVGFLIFPWSFLLHSALRDIRLA